MIKVLSVFGTRPEAIKMAPLIKEIESTPSLKSIICVTAQHREMLDQVLESFSIVPDFDLNIMKQRQSLSQITSLVVEKFDEVLKSVTPDIVLVHGDTSTSFVSALTAFYNHIPVGHVEAGLRTFDRYSPFPEEMNRSLTGRIAELHFAPTEKNKENLNKEGIYENVFITGNTVVDALRLMVQKNYIFKSPSLRSFDFTAKRFVLLTAHRRENLGAPLYNICNAIRRLSEDTEDLEFIYPVHLNPAVKEIVYSVLGGLNNVHLIDPVDVADMHNLISRCYLIMTDSGGLQEEGPALGKPVVVLRTETERPEVVSAGKAILSGVEEESIFQAAKSILGDEILYHNMVNAPYPYGDGCASKRIVQAILYSKGQGNCPTPFTVAE